MTNRESGSMTALEMNEPIDIDLPQSLKATRLGAIAHLRLRRGTAV